LSRTNGRKGLFKPPRGHGAAVDSLDPPTGIYNEGSGNRDDTVEPGNISREVEKHREIDTLLQYERSERSHIPFCRGHVYRKEGDIVTIITVISYQFWNLRLAGGAPGGLEIQHQGFPGVIGKTHVLPVQGRGRKTGCRPAGNRGPCGYLFGCFLPGGHDRKNIANYREDR